MYIPKWRHYQRADSRVISDPYPVQGWIIFDLWSYQLVEEKRKDTALSSHASAPEQFT